MILYCDTSALIKLYIKEQDSSTVHDLLQKSETVATSRISWAEAHAALARRAREDTEAEDQIESARQALKEDWTDFLVVDVKQSIVEIAGEFADTFALRGYDSVQLATARFVQQETELPVKFACFDKRLNRAALLLGMEVPSG